MILILLLLCVGLLILIPQLLMQRFGYRALSYSIAFSQPEAQEGDTITLTETICSRKLLPLPWVKAELTTHASLVFAASQSATSEDTRFMSSYFCLFPYRKIERHWKVTCTKRGVFTVSHAVIVLSDLFGVREISRPFPDATAELTVLPACRKIALPETFPQQLMGDIIRRRSLIPDRFAVSGIRPYADGDPVRDICWSASARTELPMVWQYQETAMPSLTVLLNMETRETDRLTASDHAALENEIRLCAACLHAAHAQRMPVRFCANTEIGGMPAETGFRSGSGALLQTLRMLAAIPDTITMRCEKMLTQIRRQDSAAALLLITAQPTAAIMQTADRDPLLTVISLRPLRDSEHRPNVRHIPINLQ